MQAIKREKDEFKSMLEDYKSKAKSLFKELQEKKDEISKLHLALTELKQVWDGLFTKWLLFFIVGFFARQAVIMEKEKNATQQEKWEDATRRIEELNTLREQMDRFQFELVALREDKDTHIKQLTDLLTHQEKSMSDLR